MKKRKVLYRKAAQADLAEAYDWYFAVDPGLAERLIVEIRTAADRIAMHPLSCPVYLGTSRRTRLKVFPYFLYYRLERGMIVVHAILHTHRSPSVHRKRAR